MKLLIVMSMVLGLSVACNKDQTAAAVKAVLQPVETGVCAVETEYAASAGAEIASLTGAPNVNACAAALLADLGQANICNIVIPVIPAVSGVSAKALSHPQWKKLGDIPKDALKVKGKLSAQAVSALGLVGSLSCTALDSVVIGVGLAVIPAACQGPNSVTSSAANQALLGVCSTLFAGL